MPSTEDHSEPNELAKYLKANLLLQLRSVMADETEKEKPEILLYRAGFTYKEIAELLGKEYGTVAKTIERALGESKEVAE